MHVESTDRSNDWAVSFGDTGTRVPDWVCHCARELAFIAGQFVHGSTASGSPAGPGSEPDEREAALEALPERKRWDPVPGSEGSQAPVSPSEDEDEEGRSLTDQLVLSGVEAASREQARTADESATAPESEIAEEDSGQKSFPPHPEVSRETMPGSETGARPRARHGAGNPDTWEQLE